MSVSGRAAMEGFGGICDAQSFLMPVIEDADDTITLELEFSVDFGKDIPPAYYKHVALLSTANKHMLPWSVPLTIERSASFPALPRF